jgi:hypothetical protein
MNGDRAFKKARALMREPGAHQKRMDELLGRIKTRLADIDAPSAASFRFERSPSDQ